ncbi:hypothetical protein FHS15_001538 [Paenibacillus castaneae]|uniref:DUF3888 domain-containing protein n=1 Tax=Paenibacillus castaneae TaxID=474957 RepID=UPI000C9CC31C|nr:DUF3888 domain-containing protein [Paenibacillus castaneae]NIK76413.1 hypothetical protein [Paenibacillus castaneae]
MRKQISVFFLSLFLIAINPLGISADSMTLKPRQDSTELQLQDMLMLLLSPAVDDSVNNYYRKLLKESPLVYPYQSNIVQIERSNGFRGFIFLITVEVMPVVGPHIAVGKDRITFQISAGPTVNLKEFRHIQDFELPPHWQDIIRK